jgi:hypothetical protein
MYKKDKTKHREYGLKVKIHRSDNKTERVNANAMPRFSTELTVA